MLRQMTARESMEMIAYLNSKQDRRREAEELANATVLEEFFREQVKSQRA